MLLDGTRRGEGRARASQGPIFILGEVTAEKELAKTIHGRRGEGKAGLNSDRMAALSWYQAGGLECLLACRLHAKGDVAAANYRRFLVVIASQHARS